MGPEYAFIKKACVYSFGAALKELVIGRKTMDFKDTHDNHSIPISKLIFHFKLISRIEIHLVM